LEALMASSASHSVTDRARQLVIVSLLVAALMALYRFGPAPDGFDTRGLLVLGFVVLTSYVFGEFVGVVRLPHITGYVVAGLLLGPSAATIAAQVLHVPLGPFSEGVMTPQIMTQLQPLNAFAVALIALSGGSHLKARDFRASARPIAGMLGAQALLVVPSVGALIVLLASSPVPWFRLGTISGRSAEAIFAIALLVGVLSLSTSPAATVAVIHNERSNGPLSKAVLGTVVIGDILVAVMFAGASAFAAHANGLGGAGGASEVAWQILGSIAVGALFGGVVAVYFAAVGVELMVFLVGLIWVGTWMGQQLGLSQLIMFLAAGFTTANFSRSGDRLTELVERISLPVFVVFFTLAGAGISLESLWAIGPIALALVLVRAASMAAGTYIGARLAGASQLIRNYAITGFISQAGVTLALASLIDSTYGEAGAQLATVIVAAIAIHETIGPALFKYGLGVAGETAAAREARGEHATSAEAASSAPLVAPWPEASDDPKVWGPRVDTASDDLDQIALELEGELRQLVDDFAAGPLTRRTQAAAEYLRDLRRAFLRHHQRVEALLREDDVPGDLSAQMRREQTRLAAAWREIVLARAATIGTGSWTPASLVDALDNIAEATRESVIAPVELETLLWQADESPLTWLLRGLIRVRRTLGRAIGLADPTRAAPIRAAVRFHLSGKAPADLEGLAALLVRAEVHLAARTAALFDVVTRSGEDALAASEDGASIDAVQEAIAAQRAEVDRAFVFARHELDTIHHDGRLRLARVLGAHLTAIKADIPKLGTLDLPAHRRRFGLAYDHRARGQAAVGPRFEEAERTAVARYALLALELELMGFEGQIKEVAAEHGSRLARRVRGQGAVQVQRVTVALRDVLHDLERALAEPEGTDAPTTTPKELAETIAEFTDRLAHTTSEAAHQAEALHKELADENTVAPMLDALLQAARGLTEHYTVPTGRILEGDWALPPPTTRIEVPFRAIVLDYIETQVTRDLVALTRSLAADAQPLAAGLAELERVVAFNVEIAVAEIEDADDTGPATRALVRDMVVGALSRHATRLAPLLGSATAWPDQLRERLRQALLADLERLRQQIVAGDVSELRLRLRAAAGRGMREASAWTTRARVARTSLRWAIAHTVGAERLALARAALGLPEAAPDSQQLRALVAAPKDQTAIPLVYRRLFSDQALEAGDLLTGRAAELGRARAALAGSAPLRSVLVHGVDGVGKSAVVNALVRGHDPRLIRRIVLDHPIDEAEVARWFDGRTDTITVLSGMRYLYTPQPDGFRPLRRFVSGIAEDGGKNAWIVMVVDGPWRFVRRVLPEVEQVFSTIIHLAPLGARELEGALLARHTMSGYGLLFDSADPLAWLRRDRRDPDARARARWFTELHRVSGGIVKDALRLWMASIVRVDEAEAVVVLGDPPAPVDITVRSLPREDLLALRQVHRHGWTTLDTFASTFHIDPATAAARLQHLVHERLLEKRGDGYAVCDPLRGPLGRVLAELGWDE
jgi:Kef-type K+ transport system membrane component KefB